VPEVSAAELGGLIALYERAVGLYAELVGINAYHQPGVEAGKKAAASIVRLQERVLASLGDLPRGAEAVASELQADPVEVHYLLQRLAHTGRIVVDGMGPDATYRRGRR
jgi:glucose-6-phosphate isomerase